MVEDTPNQLDDDELNRVRLLLEPLQKEIQWRRNNEQKVTLWIFALAGAALSFSYTRNSLQTLETGLLASFIAAVGWMGSWYVSVNLSKQNDLARVIVKINQHLGAWSSPPPDGFFHKKWRRWGERGLWKDKVSTVYFVIILAATELAIVGILASQRSWCEWPAILLLVPPFATALLSIFSTEDSSEKQALDPPPSHHVE